MKKIKFIPVSMANDITNAPANKFLDSPTPVKKHLPEWYKKAETFIGGKPDIGNYASNASVKACIPFLDSMMSGYTINLWTDIMVEKVGDDQHLKWLRLPDPVGSRSKEFFQTLPIPAGHSDTHYLWNIPWAVKTPTGYSALMVHPLNRFDLPFTTMSGIIDSDNFSSGGLFPFFLKKDFEGIIPAGTPLIQIIPIKRDTWLSEMDPSLTDQCVKDGWTARSVISGYYKKNRWIKKDYR